MTRGEAGEGCVAEGYEFEVEVQEKVVEWAFKDAE